MIWGKGTARALGSSLYFPVYVPVLQPLIFNGPRHAGCVTGGRGSRSLGAQCAPPTNSIVIIQKLVISADTLAGLPTYWVRICILTRTPVIQMHIQLWEAIVVERLRSWAGLDSNPNSAAYLSKSWASIFSPKKEGNTAYFKRILWRFNKSLYKKKLAWGLVYVGWSINQSFI